MQSPGMGTVLQWGPHDVHTFYTDSSYQKLIIHYFCHCHHFLIFSSSAQKIPNSFVSREIDIKVYDPQS